MKLIFFLIFSLLIKLVCVNVKNFVYVYINLNKAAFHLWSSQYYTYIQNNFNLSNQLLLLLFTICANEIKFKNIDNCDLENLFKKWMLFFFFFFLINISFLVSILIMK